MKTQIKLRLGTMMFLEYFIWGAWYVTLGTWLAQSLHFTGQQIGLAAGATAIGAILSPFFVGLIADRLFATQRVLGVLHCTGAVVLFLASRQLAFPAFYALVLLYCLCFMPTLALTNSLAFRQMKDPQLEFGTIRVLGTLGWIVAGLFIGHLRLEATAIPMQLAAACSLLMGIYSFTLPHTPPVAQSTTLSLQSIFPKEAVSLLADRPMAIFAIASFLICIPLQFYYAFTNLFLNQVGVVNAAGKMTGGQMSELFCMLLIPWFFRRLGVKYMLIAGMSAWTLRYLFFAYGNPDSKVWMLWAGILLHGICYDFFFVTGQIYIDRKASTALRSAAQGLITFLTYGIGMFTGSWLSGAVVQHFAIANDAGAVLYRWRPIWLFACAISGIVLLLFALTFKDEARVEITAMEAESNLPESLAP